MSRFKNYIVIGTGCVATSCAEGLLRRNCVPVLIESRKTGLTSLRNTCEKKGIRYLSLLGKDITEYLITIDEPSLIISAANRYLFPVKVVDKPNFTIINYHGALLPKHPGRNAEAWAIYSGDVQGGITWHYVLSGVDTGAIIDQRSVPITDKTTSMNLLRQYGQLAVESFEGFVERLLNENVAAKNQTEKHQLHFSWEKPNDGVLELDWSGEQMSSFLRAMDYGPLQTLGAPQMVFCGDTYSIEKYKIQPKIVLGEMIRFSPKTEIMVLQKNNIEITMQLKKNNNGKIDANFEGNSSRCGL